VRDSGDRFRSGTGSRTSRPFDPRLVVEVDDLSHEFRDESTRTRYFESKGFAMLRFTNRQIAQELPEAVATIEVWVEHIRCHGLAPE
jgi:very-short-patch-repair endonuclease